MENKQIPVAWVSEKELTELLTCNGMSIWAESPNVWGTPNNEDPEQLVPLFKYHARTPRDTSEHDKEIIEKLKDKIDQLEWENKGIAEWRDEYVKLREKCAHITEENTKLKDMMAHLMCIVSEEVYATPKLVNAARSASFLLQEFNS